MSIDFLFNLLNQAECSINIADLIKLLTSSSHPCIFIKDQFSNYQYGDANFIQLMGLKQLSELQKLSDTELSKNKQDALKYRELDCQVMEEGNKVTVEEVIQPQLNQPIVKTMSGTLYSLYLDNHRANYILGIVTPKNHMLKLDWELAFKLTHEELDQLLVKRSYPIQLKSNLEITLSRMEIKTLIQLLKGKHAGETAAILDLKQTTVESYIVHIKNKLGQSSKSELIDVIIHSNLLQQINI